MRILAIETTDQAGSVALLDGPQVVVEIRLPASQRSAQSLSPAIGELLRSAAWRPADVGLVAVAIGPGSFTGLRVGVTTAKTFAYAVGCALVGVPTLEAIAAQATADEFSPLPAAGEAPVCRQLVEPGMRGSGAENVCQIIAVLDAGRQQVFSARYRRLGADRVEEFEPTTLIDDAEWLAGLDIEPSKKLLTGPGLKKLATRLPAGVNVAAAESWAPRAATIGRLGFDRFQAGQRDDPASLVPIYHRRSAAEEKLAKANAEKASALDL
jgi:tRNA threonylcarbamoyladenosine biosynthesis protein TsaB